MLSAVITLFETMKTIGYYSIILSYNTGKIIVNGLSTSFEVLHKLLNTLWTVLVILQEDLLVFLFDVWSRIVLLLNGIHSFIEYVGDSVVSIVSFMKFLIFGTSDAVITFFQAIFTIVTKMIANFGILIAAIKHLVVLFGSGVWFIITLVPLFVVYLCMMATYYIGRTFEEIKTGFYLLTTQIISGLQDLFTFVTDVPLESFAGLIFCCCLIYGIVVFQIELYSNTRRFARRALSVGTRNIKRMKKLLFRRRNRDFEDSDTASSGSDMSEIDFDDLEPIRTNNDSRWMTKKERRQKLLTEESRLCVVCLERNKCILSMPCRHLCTCSECNITLRNNRSSCPICRSYVNYTIHVF